MITIKSAGEIVMALRDIKAMMHDDVWEEWFARIKAGAEGKDDW